MLGRMTSSPSSCSKQRSTESFWKVPPCTTICFPISSLFFARITLYNAFFTTDLQSPAEISSILAPFFWACLTPEFINTVQRVPKSTGCFDFNPSVANSFASYPNDFANVSINEPHPLEQASFNTISSMCPSRILKHLISCPPISRM